MKGKRQSIETVLEEAEIQEFLYTYFKYVYRAKGNHIQKIKLWEQHLMK